MQSDYSRSAEAESTDAWNLQGDKAAYCFLEMWRPERWG